MRTIFNILGPLTNPAGAANQLMGVFHADLVGIQVRVLERLGSRHVLVVHGKDGMDEASLGAATLVGELKDGKVSEYEIHPEDYGLSMMSNRSIKVSIARNRVRLSSRRWTMPRAPPVISSRSTRVWPSMPVTKLVPFPKPWR